jgi:hypothetical protein
MKPKRGPSRSNNNIEKITGAVFSLAGNTADVDMNSPTPVTKDFDPWDKKFTVADRKRLPTEAEWEFAACGGGLNRRVGRSRGSLPDWVRGRERCRFPLAAELDVQAGDDRVDLRPRDADPGPCRAPGNGCWHVSLGPSSLSPADLRVR